MEPDEQEIDIEAAATQIGNDLFGNGEIESPEAPEAPEVAPIGDKPPEAPVVRAPPKSWAKDKHEVWSKMPSEAQEYYETREKQMLDGLEQYKGDAGLGRQMREVVTPYQHLIAAQGIDAPKAVQVLLNAHFKLSNGSAQERQAYFRQVAQSYGIDLSGIAQPQAQIDPNLRALQERQEKLEASLLQRQTAQFNETRSKVESEVTLFAADPKHLYFDEVADDIVAHINAGASLQDAYDKAVWANPVTRQKELTRTQAERDKALRDKSKQDAEKARKAASSNVRSRDTARTPTEPLGKMDDTIRETLATIKARAH